MTIPNDNDRPLQLGLNVFTNVRIVPVIFNGGVDECVDWLVGYLCKGNAGAVETSKSTM